VMDESSTSSTTLAQLKSGDYFGERSLLVDDEPRTATITALTALAAYKISRAAFQDNLNLHNKLQFANRKAVGGQDKGKVETKEPRLPRRQMPTKS
ncbi:unnamed protein product, partial [Prorocentrum cordatum]